MSIYGDEFGEIRLEDKIEFVRVLAIGFEEEEAEGIVAVEVDGSDFKWVFKVGEESFVIK